MKKFFGINGKYKFEWADVSTLITVLNVTFVLLGFWWAPLLGIMNCTICLLLYSMETTHLNLYIMQMALLILNIYFLTL